MIIVYLEKFCWTVRGFYYQTHGFVCRIRGLLSGNISNSYTVNILFFFFLNPTLICNLYMPGYLSIIQSESIWVSNYDATPQYSRSGQKSILRREVHKHTRGQKNGQQWSHSLPKFFLKEHLFQNSRLRIIVHTKIIPSTKPWNCVTSIYRDLTAC